MKLLFMYHCGMGWIETPSTHPKRAYVYWLAGTLEEHVELGNMVGLLKVSIGTNPFKQKST